MAHIVELPSLDGSTVIINTDQMCFAVDANDWPEALDAQIKSVVSFGEGVYACTTLTLGKLLSLLTMTR